MPFGIGYKNKKKDLATPRVSDKVSIASGMQSLKKVRNRNRKALEMLDETTGVNKLRKKKNLAKPGS